MNNVYEISKSLNSVKADTTNKTLVKVICNNKLDFLIIYTQDFSSARVQLCKYTTHSLRITAIYQNYAFNIFRSIVRHVSPEMYSLLSINGEEILKYDVPNLEGIQTNTSEVVDTYRDTLEDMDTDDDLDITTGQLLCVIFYLVLSMAKRPTQLNFDSYRERRLTALYTMAGEEPIDKKYLPSFSFVLNLHNYFQSNDELRSKFFTYLQTIRFEYYDKLLSSTIELMRGASLTGFQVVIKELVVCGSPILRKLEFMNEACNLSKAIQIAKSMGDKFPFSKIIYPTSITNVFSQKNFQRLASIAIDIAKEKDTSMFKSYTYQEYHQNTNIVKEHFNYLYTREDKTYFPPCNFDVVEIVNHNDKKVSPDDEEKNRVAQINVSSNNPDI